MRRLQVSTAGHWYIAMTIALGVVALAANNNVLYLIESLMLSSLILSGVLSERTLVAVRMDVRRMPASAESPCRDRITLINLKGFSLFCLELGDWKNGKFVPTAFVPRLGPHTSVTVESNQVFPERGSFEWDGIAIATSYPFGLARKIRIIRQKGQRLIWPKNEALAGNAPKGSSQNRALRLGPQLSEGEIRPYTLDDDSRMIVWTLSARGNGPIVRLRRNEQFEPKVTLDLRAEKGSQFEKKVEVCAQPFHRTGEGNGPEALVLVDWNGTRRITGRERALNHLAKVVASGTQAKKATA